MEEGKEEDGAKEAFPELQKGQSLKRGSSWWPPPAMAMVAPESRRKSVIEFRAPARNWNMDNLEGSKTQRFGKG